MQTTQRNFDEIQKGIQDGIKMLTPSKRVKVRSLRDDASKSKVQILSGLEDIQNGIEKIELESSSFENDPWLWDWLTVLKNRYGIMSSAFNDHFKEISNQQNG